MRNIQRLEQRAQDFYEGKLLIYSKAWKRRPEGADKPVWELCLYRHSAWMRRHGQPAGTRGQYFLPRWANERGDLHHMIWFGLYFAARHWTYVELINTQHGQVVSLPL